MPRKAEPIRTRFYRYVKTFGANQCWEYTGAIEKSGYGKFYIGNRRFTTAHRMAWILDNGPIPPGMFACHKCDNRSCVNPNHIFIGTPKDNQHDMSVKGRSWRGERHHFNILSEKDVIEIKNRKYGPKTCRQLAVEYGVGWSTISAIWTGQNWKWLKGGIDISKRRPRGPACASLAKGLIS